MDILAARLREAFSKETEREEVERILTLIQEDGSFADIDYSDASRANWLAYKHLVRAKTLSDAYLSGGTVGRYVIRLMDYWFKYDFRCPNWWYNDLGVPMQMRMILLNCGEILDKDIKAKMVERLQAFIDPKYGGTNKLWFAENVIFRGVLTEDRELVKKGRDYLAETIFVTGEGTEGVKPDGSFTQHGMQLYNHGYGSDFLIKACQWFEIFRDTEFAFSERTVKVITDLYLNGTAKMGRFNAMDISARGREIVRCYDGTGKTMSIYKHAAGILAKCNRDAKIVDKLNKTIDFIEGKRNNPYEECNTSHWLLKYMTHHRDGFYASVRMASEGVLGGDVDKTGKCINGENYLGGFGAYGMCIYMRDGKEYEGIFPALDWSRMPGTTTPSVELPTELGAIHESRFVGGVSDGRYGLAAMDMKKSYTYEGEKVSFGGKKAYFFFDECVVHLGNSLYSSSEKEFHTTLDQCLLHTDVYVDGKRMNDTLEDKVLECDWIYHNGKAYVNLDRQPLKLRTGLRTGNYRRISRTESVPDIEVRKKIFSLVRSHEKNNAGYQYAVFPDVEPENVSRLIQSPPFSIIANDDIQAVWYKNSLYAVFYRAGTVCRENKRIEVDAPCMLILDTEKQKLYVSAPDKDCETVTVSYQGERYTVKMPKGSQHAGEGVCTLTNDSNSERDNGVQNESRYDSKKAGNESN